MSEMKNANPPVTAVIYHLTPIENVERIRSEGLRANEACEIFVFVDMRLANVIAKNQVFPIIQQFGGKYGVFKVSPDGIETEMMPDDEAGEFCQAYQFIVKQPVISSEHLTFEGEFDTLFTRYEIEVEVVNELLNAEILTGEEISQVLRQLSPQEEHAEPTHTNDELESIGKQLIQQSLPERMSELFS